MEKKSFRSGFITIIGRPNVGKSTLMNHFIGEKLAITSNKPQTTRNKIQGILTTDDYQMVFIDTPGIHQPKSKLGENMMKMADNAMQEVDCILYLIAPTLTAGGNVDEGNRWIVERLKNVKTPIFLVINKIDTVPKAELLEVIDKYSKMMDFAEIVPISALNGENTNILVENIKSVLPLGPKYFPDDMITDQPERFIVSEIIREKTLFLLQEEIPHGIAVEINSMKKRENGNITDVEATIYCERDTHKGIVIGKKGVKLKEIGTKARIDIERLFSTKVNLQLWVRVKKDWRDSDFYVKNFGYEIKD